MSIMALAIGSVLMSMQTPQPDEFTRKITKSVSARYLVSLPGEYDGNERKRWPLVLFLHGAGERGEDLEKMKVHGPMKEISAGRRIPAIVVAPQCPEGEGWNTDTLIGLLDHLESKYRVDKDRIYVTGISMGGFGTWGLAMAQPERFAAIAPVCGGGNPKYAPKIKHIPAWVVHGDKDDAVPFQRSVEMVDALKSAGGNPIFTVVAGGGHDVWTDFYHDDGFYSWLLSHRKAGR